MDAWGVVFLGIIALSSLVQVAFLIGLARGGRKLGQRLDEIQGRLDREVRPALEQIQRVSRNLGEISDLAVLQARRIDLLVGDTIEKIEETTEVVRNVVLRPLGPIANIVAVLRGLQRGLAVFQQLRGFDRHGRPRRYAEDEHLFI
jgi:hypothetical protein